MTLAISSFLCAQNVIAMPVEFAIGSEFYKETYREYQDGQCFMQQRGNLWSLTGSAAYLFNEHHAVKVEGRFSKGKITYTGAEQEGNYGSVVNKNLPRKVYDIRALYQYRWNPFNSATEMFVEPGIGYRVLRDLSSKVATDDYDRKNEIVYAHLGIGLNIPFAENYMFSPKISYHQLLQGKQYSYIDSTILNHQHNGKGIEVELLLAKKFANNTTLAVGPFYRGWKVFKSDSVTEIDEDTGEQFALSEPKNYTHEVGFKIEYRF